MSKRFMRQDYFRYPRLGKKWRRPVGLQSKLRIRKGGAGRRVSIGYRSPAEKRGYVRGYDYVIVNNANELEKGKAAFIASGVGCKKAMQIALKAKELGVLILNMKKVRRAIHMEKTIKKKQAKKESKDTKQAKKEIKEEKKGEK